MVEYIFASALEIAIVDETFDPSTQHGGAILRNRTTSQSCGLVADSLKSLLRCKSTNDEQSHSSSTQHVMTVALNPKVPYTS